MSDDENDDRSFFSDDDSDEAFEPASDSSDTLQCILDEIDAARTGRNGRAPRAHHRPRNQASKRKKSRAQRVKRPEKRRRRRSYVEIIGSGAESVAETSFLPSSDEEHCGDQDQGVDVHVQDPSAAHPEFDARNCGVAGSAKSARLPDPAYQLHPDTD
ncbi:hypothetical protein GN958_ATG02817 [Phytophthora infestans]|uniref:Uncharacterized protein n=1 Tax=Phytophthora infestans TaxID=4787 RepID=A0A8S9V794_PHYIN|nr:hypothetical protein GN958_ATG02817 [Phytophthora infestans]